MQVRLGPLAEKNARIGGDRLQLASAVSPRARARQHGLGTGEGGEPLRNSPETRHAQVCLRSCEMNSIGRQPPGEHTSRSHPARHPRGRGIYL